MTYREVTTALASLQEDVLRRYSRLGYLDFDPLAGSVRIPDVRAGTLLVCSTYIGFTGMILNAMANAEEHPEQEGTFRAWFGLLRADVPLTAITLLLSQYLRLSFTTMWQFRIEIFVTNILKMFDKQKAKRGYVVKVEALLELLEIPDRATKLKILRALANVRNSLHANGVHNKAPLHIKIGDCDFDFEPGEKVWCAGWQHIVAAVKAHVEIVEEIITSPKVAAIEETITDEYIQEG